jgi:hypothetical protein
MHAAEGNEIAYRGQANHYGDPAWGLHSAVTHNGRTYIGHMRS